MKKSLLYLWLLVTFSAQAQVSDSFTDGDFTSNPTWAGEDTFYTVNAGQQLQSNGPASQTTALWLSTPNTLFQNTQWSFWLNMDFAGTNSNQARVYLMSDQQNLEGSLNGYFVSIGQDGSSDAVRLYRQQGSTTSTTQLISGVPGRAAKASNNAMRIKVIRDTVGNWSLFSDTTSTGNQYLQEGTAFDDAITSTSYFGVLSRYTSSNSSYRTKFYYDDFLIQTAPLQIISATAISATQIEVTFSASVEIASAQNPANYNIVGIGNPFSAVRNSAEPNKVILNLVFPLADGTYLLFVSNVAAEGGGVISPNSSAGFTYTAPPAPVPPRSVVINEIMADENPQIGLPAEEFIELFNTTNAAINLSGFTFSDLSSTATIPNGPQSVVAPGGYVILAANADTAVLGSYGQVIGLSSLPSLNNTGDELTLKDALGNEIDKVAYTDAWYNDAAKKNGGWTLEQINPLLGCSGQPNWTASNDPSGGTPGRQNSVYSNAQDVTAPVLQQVTVTSPTLLTLQFSEQLEAGSMANAQFIISGPGGTINALGSTLVLPGRTVVDVTLAQPIEPALIYTISVLGVTDCAGNQVQPAGFSFGIGAAPQAYELIISEIFPDPTPVIGLTDQEYIELYNASDKLLSLAGVKFSDPTTTATLPDVVLLPGEYVVVVPTSGVDDYEQYGRVLGVSNFPSLNASGDLLVLRAPNGRHIFSVQYTDAWYLDEEKEDGGWSLEMINLATPCHGSANWRASEDPRGGTPVTVNSVNATNSDTNPPAILRADVSAPNQVIIRLDQAIDSLAALTQAQFSISGGLAIAQIQVLGPPFTTLQLTFSADLEMGVSYTLSISNLGGCTGNLLSTTISLIRPQFAAKGDIIINEILFNPRTGGADFVELYNRSEKHIDLKDWSLANVDDGIIDNLRIITTDAYVLEPGAYAVLTTAPATVKQHYPLGKEEAFLQMSSLPSYNDTEGTVILINPFEAIYDSIAYNSDMHFALIDDLNGVSLERINPNLLTYSSSNWHSASTVSGYATPGYRNSQFLSGEAAAATISVTPKVFTPDAGGDQDFTTIAYKLGAAGFNASVTVFDSRGREIKKLVRNEQLGTEGFIKWDGTTNDQTKANVGYYVFYIELFDLQGNVQVFKEPVVVGARF